MIQTTYGKLSQLILDTYYKGKRSDDATYTIRHIAEMIAMEIAFMARKNAFENSNAGEVTFANDQFISVYSNQPVLIDPILKTKYVVLPATPTALPNNQEIVHVSPTGATKRQIIPIKTKDRFMQDMLPPLRGFVLYYIEDGKLCFDNSTAFSFSAVNIKMVGAVPLGTLTDAVLNIPKNVEIEILDKIIGRLNMVRGVVVDNTNDAVSN